MASERSKDTVKRAKKRATCFVTLLQNELKSDVARFTTHVQTCLATNQVHSREVKRATLRSFPTRFAALWQNKLHVFCCPSYLTLKRTD